MTARNAVLPTAPSPSGPPAESRAIDLTPGEPAAVGPASDHVSRRWLALGALVVVAAYALLWSRWWYPLSDSALYLSLARSLASGRGYTYLGQPHRLVPAATPLLLAAVQKLGGGVGAMQAVLTALMLLAHALCYLTLRRWAGPRLALAATLAGACSYWVFVNAFTAMSEPLALPLLWGGLLCLTRAAAPAAPLGRRWAWVAAGAALLVGAADNRIAAAFLAPGPALALLLYAGRRRTTPPPAAARPNTNAAPAVPLGHRIGWAALILVAFLAFAIGHFKWGRSPRPGTGSGLLDTLAVESGQDTNKQYQPHFLPRIPRTFKGILLDWPSYGGRWVSEGLVMPTIAIFGSKSPAVAAAGEGAAFVVFLVSAAGAVQLVRRRQWWIVGMGAYFFIFWFDWGDRIKPRYMTPIVPLLFINLWTGLLTACGWVARRRVSGYDWFPTALAPGRPPVAPQAFLPVAIVPAAFVPPTSVAPGGTLSYASPATPAPHPPDASDADPFVTPVRLSRPGRVLAGLMLALVVVGNAPAWAMEFYIRHVSPRPFYVVARRGALQRLVDIADFLQSPRAKPGPVGLSMGAHRRIVYYLTGRLVEHTENDIHSFRPDDQASRAAERQFLAALPPKMPYAIVEVDRNPTWPEWHWPPPAIDPDTGEPAERWFQFYARDPEGNWQRFDPPLSDGTFIDRIPPLRP